MSVNPEAVGDMPEEADEYMKDRVNTDGQSIDDSEEDEQPGSAQLSPSE